jgi:hypothetical protein
VNRLVNEFIHPFSENEKNELVMKHQNKVFFVANRLRYFDPDIEEIKGWGFVGFTIAINQYEKNRDQDFESLVFQLVKKEIFNQYREKKRERPKSQRNMEDTIFTGNDGSTVTIGDFLPDDGFSLNEKDIVRMVEEALFEETVLNKKINMEWLFTPKEIEVIAVENQMSRTQISRTIKRGQALIKNYLVNNDIISDYLFHPSEERIKEKKIINHNPVPEKDYGKIKYMRVFYPYLTVNDIAAVMNTSSYLIVTLLDYPTVAYISVSTDDSIKEKVLRYCKKKYPERLPGPVVITKDANKILA